MARTPNRRRREASRDRARAAAHARQAAAARRRRIMAGAVVALVVLGLVGAVLGARSGNGDTAATTTTTVPDRGTASSLPASGVAPVPAPMGATLTGATPCPAEDGSSARTTLFAEPPPTCIDPGWFHIATITTSVGEMTVQLNPSLAPTAVNDFVVLARYHFYDGQPVTSVTSRASFTVGLAFSGEGADRAPGFTIPDEAPAGGVVYSPGMLVLPPATGPATTRGQLMIATYEDAAGLDPGATLLGIMLSGDEVLRRIDALATQDGTPAEPVTVTSVTVRRSSPLPA